MPKKSQVDKHHYRVVSDDKRTSYLYEYGGLISPDRCVEIAEHHKNGTTDAYEVDNSIVGLFLYGGKGAKKNK